MCENFTKVCQQWDHQGYVWLHVGPMHVTKSCKVKKNKHKWLQCWKTNRTVQEHIFNIQVITVKMFITEKCFSIILRLPTKIPKGTYGHAWTQNTLAGHHEAGMSAWYRRDMEKCMSGKPEKQYSLKLWFYRYHQVQNPEGGDYNYKLTASPLHLETLLSLPFLNYQTFLVYIKTVAIQMWRPFERLNGPFTSHMRSTNKTL